MSRTVGGATTGVRLALAFIVATTVAMLSASAASSPSLVVVAAVAVALAAVCCSDHAAAALIARAQAPEHPTADDEASFLDRLATDPLHHPLRPRAPGLV
ncbi:MAG TPA: hypothetical protein VFG72_13545 [Marmoricola sp.]|nr:hypothetical protein [Marmoricola sp.]